MESGEFSKETSDNERLHWDVCPSLFAECPKKKKFSPSRTPLSIFEKKDFFQVLNVSNVVLAQSGGTPTYSGTRPACQKFSLSGVIFYLEKRIAAHPQTGFISN